MRRKPVPHETIEEVCEQLYKLMEWVEDIPADKSDPDWVYTGMVFAHLSGIAQDLKNKTFCRYASGE